MTDTNATARWRRVAAVFDAALARTGADRAAYIAQACAGDDRLRDDVARLLAAADAPHPLLDAVALDQFDALLPDAADALTAGETLGAYRIVREIGRGGMGVVYLAERADGQFTRRVALKCIKHGMDTDAVLRRFRAERQIVASLSHPNIARLLDGGTTADGRPYFVMDYIEGLRLDEYVAAATITLEERLRLFLTVCDAVRHAHQQLVVHRDIKPANILVSKDGVPTLLDFGIAGLLDDDGTGDTGSGVRALTPEYASPEQAAGARVGTSTDVWSLGVVLYELLTGVRPHVFASRAPAAVAALLHAGETALPSTVANTPAWRRQLRGDLDTIARTALRRETEHRYRSVEAFASDIQRHLDGLPIQAQPATRRYRLAKFIGRNRAMVSAGTLLIATMIAGSVATAWQARAATRQAVRAERRFNDLRTLAHSVLFDYHDAVVNLPGSTPVRARLLRDGLTYLDKLSGEAGNDPVLQLELAQAYQRMGDVQGGSMRNNLGNSAGALVSYAKALAILDTLWQHDSSRVGVRATLSEVLSEVGILHWETGDLPAARVAIQRAQRLLAVQLAAQPTDVDLQRQMAMRHDYLGQVEFAMGHSAVARREYMTALAVLDSVDVQNRSMTPVRRSYSVTLQHLAEVLIDDGDAAGALPLMHRVTELRQALAAGDSLNAELQRALAVSYYYEGEVLARLERYREAMVSYRKDLAISRTLMQADPGNALYRGDVEYAYTRVGDMLVQSGRPMEAIPQYEASFAMHVADNAADSTNIWKRAAMIEAQAKIAETHARLQHRATAVSLLRRTADAMRATEVDSTDARIRSFFAETWAGLATAYHDLIRTGPKATAPADCTASRRLFAASETMLTDMMRRQQASQTDSTRLSDIRRVVSMMPPCGK